MENKIGRTTCGEKPKVLGLGPRRAAIYFDLQPRSDTGDQNRSGNTVTQLPVVVKRRKSKNRGHSEVTGSDPEETYGVRHLENSRNQENVGWSGLPVRSKTAEAQDRARPLLRPSRVVEGKDFLCSFRTQKDTEEQVGSGSTTTELIGVTKRKKSRGRSRSKAGQIKTKEPDRRRLQESSEDQMEEDEETEEEKENLPQARTGQTKTSDRNGQVLRLYGDSDDPLRPGRMMTKLPGAEKRKKSKSSSRARNFDRRNQPGSAEEEEEEGEEEEEDCSGLQASINKALKIVVRDVFNELYLKLFNRNHSGKKPFDVLKTIPKAYAEMKKNKMLTEILKENKQDEFDITALYLILRSACGLSSKEAQWSDTSKIEGNIKMLKELRNDDSHWTPQGKNRGVKEVWILLCRHVTLLIHLGGLSDKFPDIERDLARIKSEMMYKGISTERRNTQEGILSELRKAFRRTSTTSLKPLIWAGDTFEFKPEVMETYTSTQLEVRHPSNGLLYADAHSLFEKVDSCKRILLEGESGTGKTSLLQYYASQWANPSNSVSFLKNFNYLLLLDCRAFTNKTASLSDVISQILPQACNKWKQKNILKEISLAKDHVLILIDALDERTDAFKEVFKIIQTRCPEAFFVVTMRPHCTENIASLCNRSATVVTSKGFTYGSSLDYAGKVFQTLGRQEDPKVFIKEISEFEDLVKIPQLLVWTAWFYEEGKTNFSRRGEIFDKLTSFMLRKMCFIHGKRVMAKVVPPEGKEWLDKVAETAFHMYKEDKASIDHSSQELRELEKSAKKLGFRPYEALSSLMQCNSGMTAEGGQINFQFLHESHADFLVAHHVASSGKFEGLKHFSNTRLKNIVQCVTWLLFKDGGSPSKQKLQKLISFCVKNVSFFDLRLYLSLIIESDYNEHFVKLLCSYPTDSPFMAQQVSPISTNKRLGYKPAIQPSKNINKNVCLWITGEEFKHQRALQNLLREAKPAKLWLRLCEGVRKTEEDPSQNFTELEANDALRMLRSAYGKTPLAELRLSDTTLEGNLEFPECLWWLKLERCAIKKKIELPGSLLKLSFLECSGIGKVEIPWSLQSLRIASCKGYKRFASPNASVRTLELVDCDLEEFGPLDLALERVRISSCNIRKPPVLPRNLKHLHIEGMSTDLLEIPRTLQTLEITLTTKSQVEEALESGPAALKEVQEVQLDYIENIESILPQSSHIKTFSLTGTIQPPEDLVSLAFNVREKFPNASVRLQSYLPIVDRPLCDIFNAMILTAPLPKLCVEFAGEVFRNTMDVEDHLRNLRLA